jgi:hypothetical protein
VSSTGPYREVTKPISSSNYYLAQEEYDTVLTPSQVELQNIQLVIHPLVNDLEYSWAFPSDPAVVTVDLSLIQSDPLLARHLPDELPTYDRAVSYHDKGDEANIRIKIVALKDYKLIPFCTPPLFLLVRRAALINWLQLSYPQVFPELPKFRLARITRIFRSQTRTVLVYLTL